MSADDLAKFAGEYNKYLTEAANVMQEAVDHAAHAQAAFASGNFTEFVQHQHALATQRMNEWYEQYQQQQQPGSDEHGSPHTTPSTG